MVTPPPHILQMEFRKAVLNLENLLDAYQYFIDQTDPDCKIYELPKICASESISTLSLSEDLDEYERSRNDDDACDRLRHLKWGKSFVMWLRSLCDHYHAAKT